MSRKTRWVGLLIALILSFVAEKQAGAILICIESQYEDYVCDDQGFSCSCSGSGGGCTSCHHGGLGGGGSSDCVYNWVNGDYDCIFLN
jgi:hypothetical protein